MRRDKAAFQDLFEGELSKSERTRLEIAKAAISSYAKVGAEGTNFDRVAKSAGVTRPLVQHYFASREALFAFTVKYVRSHAVTFARERTAAKPSGKAGDTELRVFLETCLDWAERYPDHVRVALLFQYCASVDPELRELNSEFANSLHLHLAMLLLKSRRATHGDLASLITVARMLLHFLTGTLISRVTETRPTPVAEFRKDVIRRCLELAAGQ